MAISRYSLLRRYASRTLLLFASISSCGVALCADVVPEDSSASKPTQLQNITNRASELAMQAMSMLGINYKRGGNTPENGLDCSGLVRYVYKEAWGTNLPRTSLEISRVGETVKTQDLQPGDLVFFNTLRRGFSHVGIYLGEHKFIHSPASGGQVRIESMDISYWKKRFNGARRISEPAQKTAATSPSPIEFSGPIPY